MKKKSFPPKFAEPVKREVILSPYHIRGKLYSRGGEVSVISTFVFDDFADADSFALTMLNNYPGAKFFYNGEEI